MPAGSGGDAGVSSRRGPLALGALQYEYLLGHGLTPADRMLEIGCGNLRAGWRFIDYLRPGHYHGIDISPDILLGAGRTVARQGLQDKLPHLSLVRDLTFDFLPAEHFSVVHAHSVFSHSPPEVVEECLRHVGRILRPSGFFDFSGETQIKLTKQKNRKGAEQTGRDDAPARINATEPCHHRKRWHKRDGAGNH